MNWDEFTQARTAISEAIGKDLSLTEFEKLLGAGGNSAPNWKKRGFPAYIEYSINAHLLLPANTLKEFAKNRGIT
ncbi:hypothetical protein ABMA58_00240 [Oceanospirillum sp. HFRX-1_2]